MPASEPARFSRALTYLIAGLIHATAMLLAFPPLGYWGFAFIAPVPLIWAGWVRGRDLSMLGRNRARLGRGPLLVALGSSPLHFYAHQWVVGVSSLGYPPYILIMSAWAGVYVWMLSVVVARWPRLPLTVVAPVLWTAVEVFRGEVFFSGYPWILSAHPLIDAPLVHLPASLLGTYFVGFLVAVLASALVDAIVEHGRKRWIVGALAGVGAAIGTSLLAYPASAPGVSLHIGIVQSNVPQSNKLEWAFESRMRDFRQFCELTRRAASGKPDLIVWPETMFPGMTLSPSGIQAERDAGLNFEVPESVDIRGVIPSTEFHDRLLALSAETGIPMLVGALGFDDLSIQPDPSGRGVQIDFKARYNSAFDVSGGKIDPRPYSKLELTPFGEVMPGIRRWPWLQAQVMALGAGGMSFDLSPGPGPRTFDVGAAAAVVTPICFEATKPGLCRRLVRAAGDRPVVMVNLTNDGWFGSFRTGRLQHLQVARWRCVELGVPMVRAANTGLSAAIDSRGRVVASGVDGHPGAWNTEGVLSASVTPALARTLYARIGDLFGWGALIVAGIGFSVALVTGRRTVAKSEDSA